MKEEVLKNIRNSYVRMKNQQKENRKIYDRLERLKQNKAVQEYLDLQLKLKNLSDMTDEEMIDVSVQEFSSYIDKTNQIYVCLGEYLLDNMKYKRYMNVEKNGDSFLIASCDSLDFEKNHLVIFFDDYEKESFKIGNKFREIQFDFFKTAIRDGQEEACRRVLTKKY